MNAVRPLKRDSQSGHVSEITPSDTLYGVNATQVMVDFGNLQTGIPLLEDTTAATTALASWVTPGTVFSAVPTGGLDHPDADEAAAEGITISVGNIEPGVSFDVIAQAPNGSWGQYLVDVIAIG